MASETPTKEDSFTVNICYIYIAYNQDEQNKKKIKFTEYVSPTPKSIPIDAKLKPDPLIVVKPYKKTESKCIDKECDDKTQCHQQQQEEKECVKQTKRIKPTPLKVKVTKQQNEIESLKAQLFALKIENEKLKSRSNSNSVTPENEENTENVNDEIDDDRHIAFNPSVDILNGDNSSKKVELTDKVSVMRSIRNSTPCKPKVISIKPLSFFKNKNHIKNKNKNKDNNNNDYNNNNQQKKTRNDYRITPIPFKRNVRKKFAFKSKLHSIEDKENMKNNFNQILDESETPKDFNKIKHLKTPINHTKNDENEENEENEDDESIPNLSFNFGRERSETPSFLKLPTNKSISNSFNMESTPEYSNNTGDGASNFVSPILTPIRGQKVDEKPFLFTWNKKK